MARRATLRLLLTTDKAGGNTMTLLGYREHGGFVGTSSIDRELMAFLAADEDAGSVVVFSEDTESMAALNIDENGGHVSVTGKSEGKAAMGINEFGNGAVSTWDKNGYRQ